MSDWDDDDDDDLDDDDDELIEFDPAQSAIKSGYDNDLDSVCKRKFVELHMQRYPDENVDVKRFNEIYKYVGEFRRIESYIRNLITHYYKSKLPYEDDLEAIDITNFPSNKELKRFIISNTWSFDFLTIDRYSDTQPMGDEKVSRLDELLTNFKEIKSLAYVYYPQLENLPARGFRELERSLYTINYLMMIDLYESKDKLLGLNKEFYEEYERKKQELRKKKEEHERKENNGQTWFEKYEQMTEEEKEENERIIEENERLRDIEFKMRERFFETMSDTYLEYYNNLKIPRESFLAKIQDNCWYIFRDGFYMVYNIIEHYKTSSEPLKDTQKDRYDEDKEEYLFRIYKKMMENGGEGLDNFYNSIDQEDRDFIEVELGIEEMTKTALKVAYEFFPEIANLPPCGIIDVKYDMEIIGKEAFYGMDEVYERLFNIDPEYYEKRDREIEEMRRNKYYNGEL